MFKIARKHFSYRDIEVIALTFLLLTQLSACGDGEETPHSTIKAVIISSEVVKLNTDTTVSAAGSSSTGSTPLAYKWKLTTAPDKFSGIIKSPSSRDAKLYASSEGAYTIKLTVSDGTASDSTEKEIYVDLDGDGILSKDDKDMDGDGILNMNDAFPEDITEWVDSDKDGTGNYTQPDEDLDGFNDEADDFPFDAARSTIAVINETEFNGNLYPDGNRIGGTYPFRVSGSIESSDSYPVDVDYYIFKATGGDLISIVLRSASNDFNATISLLDNLGSSLATVRPSAIGNDAYSLSARIPTSGEYAFIVSDINNKTSHGYTYSIDVFKDSDMDGLSDEKELAMGMIYTNPDSDGDNLNDGFEYYISKNQFDSDSDMLPAWWDNDSDNDGIEDIIEGAADVDNDGLPNFLDLDSDGNGIEDIEEFGTYPLTPTDTDGDLILDFVDLDDDADGLLDVNDSYRLVKATRSSLSDKDNNPIVLSLLTELANLNKQVRNISRIGDSITIFGEGFGSDPLILWEHKQCIQNIKPDTSVDTEVTFAVPKGVGTGHLSVSNGTKISNSLNIDVIGQDNPLIFSVATASGNAYATPNETLTIEGANFTEPSISVSFDGLAQSATIITDTTLQVVVPQEAPSGDLVIVGSGISNPIAVEIRQWTSGIVNLPTLSNLALTDLTVEFIGSSESRVSEDGSFALATRNQGPTSIAIFAPEKPGGKPAVFLAATVLPGQEFVEVSPQSTAADLIYSAMGLDASIHNEDQIKALDILQGAVIEFGNFLDRNLGYDSNYLEYYHKDEIKMEYLKAFEEAGKALDIAIENGTIRPSDNNPKRTRSNNSKTRSSTGDGKILPKEDQEDFVVTFKNSNDTYNGFINIENDTMMFADFKATNAYNENIIRDHANGYFSSNLLGPQGGIFSLEWGNDVDVNLKYISAKVVIYTPGLQGMKSWNDYYHSPSYKLAIRTFMSQAMVPVVNAVAGVKLGDSTTNELLRVLFSYGVFDGIEEFWTNQTSSGFADGVGHIIKKATNQVVLEKIVQSIAKDLDTKSVRKLAGMLGLKLTPWGSAATVITVSGTAIDLGKLSVDVGTTHGQIDYKVLFPIVVESAEPSVIIKDDEPKDITLEGAGLGPIIKGSILGDSVYYPSVEFIDKNGKTHTDSKPRYESYLTAQGSTPPHLPLKVTLPVKYLKDAESPLLITLHHNLVDEDLFSDDIVPVDVETQHEIELVEKLTISSINPNKGAWAENVRLSGAGFSEIITDNNAYFTDSDGKPISATITNSSATELAVIVPKGSDTGDVWLSVQSSGENQESNKLLFTLEHQYYTFRFGDNGAANDDTFALYIDGKHVQTMPEPTRAESTELTLISGRHTATLHGITAPDDVGTYYVDFPDGITVVSGDPISGSDLTAGNLKSWILEVHAVYNKMIKRQSVDIPNIMWRE